MIRRAFSLLVVPILVCGSSCVTGSSSTKGSGGVAGDAIGSAGASATPNGDIGGKGGASAGGAPDTASSGSGGGKGGSSGRQGSGGDGTASSSGNACSGTADLYVAPGATGTACSCAAPCSLESARSVARALAPSISRDTVVELGGGSYRLGHPFTLDATDSGQSGHAIVWRAAPRATPVLNGAVRVTGFIPSTPAGVMVADVPKKTGARQLWVNGRRATRARTTPSPAGWTKTSTGFALGYPAVASWPDATSLEVVGTMAWKSFRCGVASVSAAGLVLQQPCWGNSQAQVGVTFDEVAWLENAREMLDEGGEFYLDDAAGKLYYLPRDAEDLGAADVELPVVEQLMVLAGTPATPIHDIALRGLGFSYASWTAPNGADGYASLQASITARSNGPAKPLANVTVHAASNLTIDSCQFSHLGGAALALEVGTQATSIVASRFEDVSASAVMIGDVTHDDDHHPSDPSLIVKDNVLTQSLVMRAGAEYFDAAGVFVGYTTHTTVSNNELFDLPYTGVSVGWGWGSVDPPAYATPTQSHDNDIRRNIISHHMRMLRDGGAIYLLGAQQGSTLAENVIHNQAAPFGNLYLDNGARYVAVTNNVVFLDSKLDVSNEDRSYWLYVQVYDPVANNNVVSGNFTNDPTPFTPRPINPSNQLSPPTVLGADLSPAASLFANAGSPLRSPNVAAAKPATASSEWDAGHGAALGCNDNAYDGWSPSDTDKSSWWQVDLGKSYAIDAIDVVTRWGVDQPDARRNFSVKASNDPSFANSTVLGNVDGTGLAHQSIWSQDVTPPVTARYVRVAKTKPEYFFLAEVRVHGK